VPNAIRSTSVRAKPTTVDQYAPNEGDDHDWILENQELMPQGKNLSVQRRAGSKSLPNRRKEQENDREHGLSKLSGSPPNSTGFNESSFW
jgi:hypothetical protein